MYRDRTGFIETAGIFNGYGGIGDCLVSFLLLHRMNKFSMLPKAITFNGTTINDNTNIRNSLKNQGIKGQSVFCLTKTQKPPICQ
jgi:hypothetical protein